jgi:hypothetical protein
VRSRRALGLGDVNELLAEQHGIRVGGQAVPR